jgi:hypothetical protein
MCLRETVLVLGCFGVAVLSAQTSETNVNQQQTPLIVPAGVPVRLYLTKRIPKRTGSVVEARVLDPVYAFDRQVIPAGAVVKGSVMHLQPVSKWQRLRAILGGDFTPLHRAPVEFNTLIMPDGAQRPLHTEQTVGLNSIVPSRPTRQQSSAPQTTGIVATGKQQIKDAIQAQIDRARNISDTIRGPNKIEKLEDYLLAKLPYHPQYIRRGTRFDAELLDPLSFGAEAISPDSLSPAGTQPSVDTVVHARLITSLDSFSSRPGQAVEAVLAEPVFAADHKLILPEGTHLEGKVVVARKARLFHRSGQLRFNFQEVVLPPEMAHLQTETVARTAVQKTPSNTLQFRTQADIQGAESTGKASLKVDSEGGVQAHESKTRFLAAAAALIIARRAGDNDTTRNSAGQAVGQDPNVAGRTLGGGLGFGMLGSAIAQSSRYVGAAFGYYGMAWAVYSALIARGAEVQFSKNAMLDIRFNARPEHDAKKQHATGTPPATGHFL